MPVRCSAGSLHCTFHIHGVVDHYIRQLLPKTMRKQNTLKSRFITVPLMLRYITLAETEGYISPRVDNFAFYDA